MLFLTHLSAADRRKMTYESLSISEEQLFHQIDEGQMVSQATADLPIKDVPPELVDCSLVYALSDGYRFRPPIFCFQGNQSLRRAKLYHLVSAEELRGPSRLTRTNEDLVYFCCLRLMKQHDWIDSVSIPCRLHQPSASMEMEVQISDAATSVSLKDLRTKPWSKRR